VLPANNMGLDVGPPTTPVFRYNTQDGEDFKALTRTHIAWITNSLSAMETVAASSNGGP